MAFAKSEINWFWSKLFQFLLNRFDLDLGEFAKKIFSDCNLRKVIGDVDVRLPDTMFWGKSSVTKNVINQSWRKFLVVAILEGIENLMKVCQQNYWQVQMFRILADLYVKIAKKKNFLWVFLIKLF